MTMASQIPSKPAASTSISSNRKMIMARTIKRKSVVRTKALYVDEAGIVFIQATKLLTI